MPSLPLYITGASNGLYHFWATINNAPINSLSKTNFANSMIVWHILPHQQPSFPIQQYADVDSVQARHQYNKNLLAVTQHRRRNKFTNKTTWKYCHIPKSYTIRTLRSLCVVLHCLISSYSKEHREILQIFYQNKSGSKSLKIVRKQTDKKLIQTKSTVK